MPKSHHTRLPHTVKPPSSHSTAPAATGTPEEDVGGTPVVTQAGRGSSGGDNATLADQRHPPPRASRWSAFNVRRGSSMGKPTVTGQPTCRNCTRLSHEDCTGCTGCGCEISAQWSAKQSADADPRR